MKVVKTLAEWHVVRESMDDSVGFVPTMGALHAGHAALLERSVRENRYTVLSIYVNPTQFNNADDLDNYPCTLEADLKLAADLGVHAVLLPRYQEIYPDGFRFRVDETDFSHTLCGAHRPGHFTGVLTVVMKLFNIVRPRRAYFGEKDHQQLTLIRDMARAFFLPVDVVSVPTVRDSDGLALSSRNLRLSPDARRLAPTFSRLLASAAADAEIAQALIDQGFTVDYVETINGRRYGAVVMACGDHTVRLIDNVPAPEPGFARAS
ncbi:MAG: pantoate--beta-alanine ligase [Pseudomonadales bacterium]|nr:pantoate--beta-alanine ligase [Gammaproteobacteria bacterium]MCP5182074.1 pantoate--beta-alanine ligase [Pseudomonadales bacterium]MCP5184189.1 pantoate--beta-alanine ligase [Pseudomonadales bacterium]